MAPKELVKYMETRFATNFLMLARVLEMSQPLRQLVVSDEWAAWPLSTSVAGIACRTSVLDDEFWCSAEYIGKIADPIICMMRRADGDDPCIGKIYEGMDRMIEMMRSVIHDEDIREEVCQLAIQRWDRYHVPLHAAAYVLDPEFQGKGQEADKEVIRGWERVLRSMVPDSEQRRLIKNQLAFYRQKRGMFGWGDAQQDRFRIGSALWWEDYGADTPELRSLAIRILSQGASSSPCERLWSSFGHIVSKKRNRFGVQNMSDLVYVNANLRLLQRMTGEFAPEEYIGWSHDDDSGTGTEDGRDSPEDVQGLDTQATVGGDIGADDVAGADDVGDDPLGDFTLGPDTMGVPGDTFGRETLPQDTMGILGAGLADIQRRMRGSVRQSLEPHSQRSTRQRMSHSIAAAAGHGDSQRPPSVPLPRMSQQTMGAQAPTQRMTRRPRAEDSMQHGHVGTSRAAGPSDDLGLWD